LEREVNYLQNKYIIFLAVNSTIFTFFKHLKKHITLLTYLLPCPAVHVPHTSSRRWGTVGLWHSLQQSAVDSAV